MLFVNLSIRRHRIVVAKVVDCLNIRALEECGNNLELVRSVRHVGLTTCERKCLGQRGKSSFRGIGAQGLLISNVDGEDECACDIMDDMAMRQPFHKDDAILKREPSKNHV